MSDPTDFEAIEEVQFIGNCRVEVVMASRAQLTRTINDVFYDIKPAKSQESAPKSKTPDVDEAMAQALIPLLIDKGVITFEELRKKADEPG
jgi:hypothetical protein